MVVLDNYHYHSSVFLLLGTNVSRNIHPPELLFPGTKVVGNLSSQELLLLG